MIPSCAQDLDENCLDNILSYVQDAPARGTCKKWADHIFNSCNLEDKIRLMKLLHENGALEFDCFAARELGPDIAETASFHFEFFPDQKFELQWYHSYSGDGGDGCQVLRGKWRALGYAFACELLEEPKDALCDPPAGVTFHIPHDLVLVGKVVYIDDATPFPWGLAKTILSHGTEVSDQPEKLEKSSESLCVFPPKGDPPARYIDVDGNKVAVCTDIVANHPEESWANLMRIRLRFGTL
jgi:hypothetical protein